MSRYTSQQLAAMAQALELVEAHGLSSNDLAVLAGAEPASAAAPAPVNAERTMAEYVPQVLASFPNPASQTARTYASYLHCLIDGVHSPKTVAASKLPVWLQALVEAVDEFELGLEVSADVDDYPRTADGTVQLCEGFATRAVAQISQSELQQMATWIRARALANRRMRDAKRAEEGRPAMGGSGTNAVETFIAATRHLFERAVGDKIVYDGDNPARKLRKPQRAAGRRKPLTDEQMLQLEQVVCATGRDPQLDRMLWQFFFHTAARREAALKLRLHHLREADATIVIPDKNSAAKAGNQASADDRIPVPPELIGQLAAFARSRGASDPGDVVFRYEPGDGDDGVGAPLTERRFDHLVERVRRHLPWADEHGWSLHWLRHQYGLEATTGVPRGSVELDCSIGMLLE